MWYLGVSSTKTLCSVNVKSSAVGIAAALSADKKCDPRQLDAAEVRQIVQQRGATLDV
jgi:hypothetical protein